MNMIMAHIIMYARKSAPLCADVGGAYNEFRVGFDHTEPHDSCAN